MDGTRPLARGRYSLNFLTTRVAIVFSLYGDGCTLSYYSVVAHRPRRRPYQLVPVLTSPAAATATHGERRKGCAAAAVAAATCAIVPHLNRQKSQRVHQYNWMAELISSSSSSSLLLSSFLSRTLQQ